ncbi:nickel pincer cofactor biosynthesis protein LarC [Pelosinus baikalensis]|uniref:Pyridinium-3,5-bisthiocarboxylic acid mononucleotide nickel insertion protein n=1 Tax=Pelosinus baikalensis TaxID=2892015 RepID=A0ABS8HMK7_9FIRM|nr:nickel pincer cofactor biosynthesis protein LarC [Pelosinus baikalensis]MCC5464405.1 nickel pincer cofactor biosynthesis protein LarC [Pelosinus baikalensis]
MKTLYLDCFSGISGNMLLGALLHVGLPEEVLRKNLSLLPVHGYDLIVTEVNKCGISAIYVDVKLNDDHHHHDDHDHHRHLSDVFQIIDDSRLSPKVKADSKKIFLLLAQAEAKVHGVGVEEIHFHEVGAVDAIVDIVGTAIGLDYLGIQAIYTSALQVGKGFVKCAHGLMPIPAPATAELLKNIPYYSGETSKELVTPTGAAVIAALSTGHGNMPANFLSKTIGYGAGTWDLEIPNVLRMHVGEIKEESVIAKTFVVEANIDDLNPQIYPYVMDKLLKMGVFDVWLTPIIMKKNRSATMLSVLVNDSLLDQVIALIFEQTSTIGLRYYATERKIAMREMIDVKLPWGKVKVKVSAYEGKICSITPEYEDCKIIADEYKIPLKKVQQAALETASIIIKGDAIPET